MSRSVHILILFQRGEHDIENELMFKSNPGYIFHDSRGFESGSASEVERVKAFISDRSWTGDLPKQIHAIWWVAQKMFG
jgi:tRNA pseudouridine-54 N-methylase